MRSSVSLLWARQERTSRTASSELPPSLEMATMLPPRVSLSHWRSTKNKNHLVDRYHYIPSLAKSCIVKRLKCVMKFVMLTISAANFQEALGMSIFFIPAEYKDKVRH